MNKFDRILMKYFIVYIPALVLLIMLSLFIARDQSTNALILPDPINTLFGVTLIIWILTSLYLFIKMIISQTFRDQTLKKVLKVKETDEREALISGEAAKISMLSTMAFLLFILFLSTLNIQIHKKPGAQLWEMKKEHSLTIGFDPFMQPPQASPLDVEVITYTGLPLPTPILLIIVFFWQLGAFHLVSNRMMKGEF